MPVIQSASLSEIRSGSTPSSYQPNFVAKAYLGLLALFAVAGTRYIVKFLTDRRKNLLSLPATSSYLSKIPTIREFVWPTIEKSRGVSTIPLGETMSAGHVDRSQIARSSEIGNSEALESGTEAEARNYVLHETAETRKHEPTKGSGYSPSILPHPLPAPPITLSEPSHGVFNFYDRRRSFPPGAKSLDTEEFISQPNPDYIGESSSDALPAKTSSSTTATPTRSYINNISTDMLPTISSQTESRFISSSFPPTSLLPPPPAELPELGQIQHGDNVQDETVSSPEETSHIWKRHTRVYGSGVCLACLQSGDGEGGFYGANVRPEDRR